MFISLVFNTITYSLTAGIGKIGEAISFVLLVVQIAAGGGLYPIEVLPKFFQDIYKWLPFKYSIGATIRRQIFLARRNTTAIR